MSLKPLPPIIILAAGKSSRMGAPKGLLTLHDKRWVDVQINQYKSCGGKMVVLVIGESAQDYLEHPILKRAFEGWLEVKGLWLRVVQNLNPGLGKFSSLQVGLKFIPAHTPVLVQPIDVPVCEIKTFQALQSALQKPALVAAPVFESQGGHPVLLSSEFQAEMGKVPLTHMGGLENPEARLDLQIKKLKPEQVAKVSVSDPVIVMNLNTPEDWQKYLQRRLNK